ncbi:MAG: hypothetical protein OXE50_16025 [Chloroflexi bacterium]|nr:hypothetical protein [Chloroflexota bacterium]
MLTQNNYSTTEILDTNDKMWSTIKSIFPDNRADKMNWLLCSTSGIHGSYTTLDEIEKDPAFSEYPKFITILIIQPRRCHLFYTGELEIRDNKDITWLRNMIESSIHHIIESQKGNRWTQ